MNRHLTLISLSIILILTLSFFTTILQNSYATLPRLGTSLNVQYPVVTRGNYQIVHVTITSSGHPVPGAIAYLYTNPWVQARVISCTTNPYGQCTLAWVVSGNAQDITVAVYGIKSGYSYNLSMAHFISRTASSGSCGKSDSVSCR